jgi:hypothetical protein
VKSCLYRGSPLQMSSERGHARTPNTETRKHGNAETRKHERTRAHPGESLACGGQESARSAGARNPPGVPGPGNRQDCRGQESARSAGARKPPGLPGPGIRQECRGQETARSAGARKPPGLPGGGAWPVPGELLPLPARTPPGNLNKLLTGCADIPSVLLTAGGYPAGYNPKRNTEWLSNLTLP